MADDSKDSAVLELQDEALQDLQDDNQEIRQSAEPGADQNTNQDARQDETSEQSLLGHNVTRRSFIAHAGAAGIAASASPLLAVAAEPAAAPAHETADGAATAMPVTLNINGQEHHLELDPRTTLLDCLRENLNLPGTKKGCDHGQCGACTVHVNGRRVNSCLSFAVMHQGDRILTIEGLGEPGHMHPIQAAFVEHDAFQCGYCTSGQIMSAAALEKEGVRGESDEEIKGVMYGNICRCGAYPNIVAAVRQGLRHSMSRTEQSKA